MNQKGDNEKQVNLRNTYITEKGDLEIIYIKQISELLKSNKKVLDIGCGTAHIILHLAKIFQETIFIGLDISTAMLRQATENCRFTENIILIRGDGLNLPFSDSSIDIVITRLSEFLPREVFRVLKSQGNFLVYGLGPDANKEIKEFFGDRIERDSFFIPENLSNWKEEANKDIAANGFKIESMDDYAVSEYYSSKEKIMDLIEMVPLVSDFSRTDDSETVSALCEKYKTTKGIELTWHYYIMRAIKP